MASDYETITPEELELADGFSIATPGSRVTTEGYSSIFARYTDGVIDARISMAEGEFLNHTSGITLSSSSPKYHKSLIKRIAAQFMLQLMIKDSKATKEHFKIITPDIAASLKAIMGTAEWSFGFASHEDIPLSEIGDGN